jgi:hypothetical protein
MLKNTIQTIYDNTIRSRLPRAAKGYNGVVMPHARMLDLAVSRPEYKEGTIGPLRERLRPDDHVVTVGGGFGVSATVAARYGGHVDVFEAAEQLVRAVRETAHHNRVRDAMTVHHAIVAEPIDVYGYLGDAERVGPAALPECDVLELDCEGAEAAILDGLDQRPRVIIVECHPEFDVDPYRVRSQLQSWGYRITNQHAFDVGANAPNETLTAVRDDV